MVERYQPDPAFCRGDDPMSIDLEGEYVDWGDWLKEHNARVIAESKLDSTTAELKAYIGEHKKLVDEHAAISSRLDAIRKLLENDEVGEWKELMALVNGAVVERPSSISPAPLPPRACPLCGRSDPHTHGAGPAGMF